MPARELQAKDVKLIQYLNEAYGKEKQLENALAAHIQMTTRAPYKKRLQQHLKETREHGRQVSRRIKALGGKPETVEAAVQNVAKRAAAAAQGPLHLLRGTGEQEKLLKNAKTEFQDVAEEIATYSAIETLAGLVGDKETAKVAKAIRREEERMRDFLGKLIPQLTKAVAQEEIPPAERRGGGTGRGRSTARRGTAGRSTARRGTSTARSRAGTARRGTSTARSRAGTRRGSSTRSGSRSTSSRSGSSRPASSRTGSSRSASSRSRSGSSSRTSGARPSSSRSTTSARGRRATSGGTSRTAKSRSSSSRSPGSRSSSRSARSGGSKKK